MGINRLFTLSLWTGLSKPRMDGHVPLAILLC